MRAEVRVWYKDEVIRHKGESEEVSELKAYSGVKNASEGRYFELAFDGNTSYEEAENATRKICEVLLTHPARIEHYAFRIVDSYSEPNK